jgi:uncharacterized damage-inducible protein DinB
LNPDEPKELENPMSSGDRRSSPQAAALADVPARLKYNRLFLKLLVRGFNEEDWLRLPAEGLSNALWVLGHLAWGRMTLLRRLGEELPGEAWENHFSIGSRVEGSPGISASELLDKFTLLGRLLVDRLESMEQESLGSPLEKPMPDGTNTVAGLVRFMCFHESYHLGQMGLLRRLNGKPGLA